MAKEIDSENIVKGLAHGDGEYIVLAPDEIATAYPKTTQTIEIEAFVPVTEIPFFFLDRPYYVTPINKSNKVYALLREVLQKTGKVGVAKVVIQTRQHLALLVPVGAALMLELLRWNDEMRDVEELDLPPAGIKASGLSAGEMDMAEKLVDDMSSSWKPKEFVDTFKEQILKLVEEKIKKGDIATVEPVEKEAGPGAKIYDLTDMLRRSLHKGKGSEDNKDEEQQDKKITKPEKSIKTKKVATARKSTSTRTAASRKKA